MTSCNFVLSIVEHEKSFITWGPDVLLDFISVRWSSHDAKVHEFLKLSFKIINFDAFLCNEIVTKI